MDNEILYKSLKKESEVTFVWIIILYPRAYRQIIVI